MAKYQQYNEYKDSGVEWLGDIPKGWNTIQVGRLYTRNKRTGFVEKELLSVYRDYGVIPKSSRDDNNNKPSDDLSLYQLVKPDDLVMNKMKAWQGSIAISEYEGIVSPAYFVYEPNFKLFDLAFPRYVHYLLRNPIYITQYMSRSKGIRVNQWDLDPDEFKKIELLLPSKDEQSKIFEFLDHETAQIDTLIEKQQTLIQLLKEKRQAVISHAVTKGLNPDAPMKDSGVEWLGEVPEHWEVVQAKYIADITRGAILRPVDAPEYFDENGEWSYLNISDATKCDKYLYESKLRLSPLGSKKSARVYPNNLIITASATIGKAFINKVKVCVHDGFIPFCNIKVDINYLYHYVSNPYLYAAMGKSNTQKNIYLDEVKNMIVTVPSREEQEKIVEHIEKNQNEYSKLIDKAQQQIQLMQERRTALISAAVTGKIDVRGWTAPDIEVGT